MLKIKTTGKATLFFYDGANKEVDSSQTLELNKDYLIVHEFNASGTCTQYINGAIDGTISVGSKSWIGAQEGRYIGSGRQGNSEFWNGSVNMRIYNRVLTETERLQLWHEFNRKLGGGSDFGAYVQAPTAHFEADGSNTFVEVSGQLAVTRTAGTAASDSFGVTRAISAPNQSWSSVTGDSFVFWNNAGWKLEKNVAAVTATGINTANTVAAVLYYPTGVISASQQTFIENAFKARYPCAFRRSIPLWIQKDTSTKFLIQNGVDISGNGNNPTYVGSPVALRAGQMDTKSYDGSTQYGYVTDTSANFVAGLSTMTAACWYKGTASGSMMIFNHWEWGPWLIKKNGSNQLEVLVRTAGVNTTVTTSVAINDGKWHHLGLVYDGTNMKAYLDGYMVQSAAKTGTLTHSTAGSPAYVMFASNRQTGPTFTEKLNGITDGQLLSARAYSTEELRQLMYSTYRQ